MNEIRHVLTDKQLWGAIAGLCYVVADIQWTIAKTGGTEQDISDLAWYEAQLAELQTIRRAGLKGGTMNKVKTWEESEDGDVVLVPDCENTRTLFLRTMEGYMRCQKCYYGVNNMECPIVLIDGTKVALCDTHHSACQVYFESGAGNVIPEE